MKYFEVTSMLKEKPVFASLDEIREKGEKYADLSKLDRLQIGQSAFKGCVQFKRLK